MVKALVYSLYRQFTYDRNGSVAPLLALAILPIMGAVGAAVDYSRAAAARTKLQAALDSALLAGARDGTAQWKQVALNTFTANAGAADATPTFSQDAGTTYTGQITTTLDTKIMGVLGVSQIPVTVRASATVRPEADDSCILTLDPGQPRSHVSMRFNGAPSVRLEGCSIRSNTSLDCNGHNGGATASFAAGTVSGCNNPRSYARVVDDIYAPLALNIPKICGSLATGVTWTSGLPPPPSVQIVTAGLQTKYHVCGDLELIGRGPLLPGVSDSLIVVENGSIKVAQHAEITIARTTLVLTGGSHTASTIEFPNGNGKEGTLSLSPPVDPSNVWRGISLYQDPALSKSTTFDWGPGAKFNADGVVYLPKADLRLSGNAGSGNTGCTKFVVKTFTTNGNVSLNFSQSKNACALVSMQQWSDVPVHLVE